MHSSNGRVGKGKQEVLSLVTRNRCMEGRVSQEERTGYRCLAFSRWRRRSGPSLLDERHTAIDIDWCEYCCTHNRPLALIEGVSCKDAYDLVPKARSKNARVTKKLAEMAGIDAYVIAYSSSGEKGIELAAIKNLFTGGIECVDSNGLSRFLHSVHSSCKECEEVEAACKSSGINFIPPSRQPLLDVTGSREKR